MKTRKMFIDFVFVVQMFVVLATGYICFHIDVLYSLISPDRWIKCGIFISLLMFMRFAIGALSDIIINERNLMNKKR